MAKWVLLTLLAVHVVQRSHVRPLSEKTNKLTRSHRNGIGINRTITQISYTLNTLPQTLSFSKSNNTVLCEQEGKTILDNQSYFLSYFYSVWMCVLPTCMYVQYMCAWWPQRSRRGPRIPQNWSGEWLWTTAVVLKAKPRSSARASYILTMKPSFQPMVWNC